MAAGHGAYVPPTAPPFGASEARKTVHKINKQPRKDARCAMREKTTFEMPWNEIPGQGRAEQRRASRAERAEQSRAFAFVFQINFEMHK